MLKKQDLGINPYVVNNGSRDQSLTGIGGPRVTLLIGQYFTDDSWRGNEDEESSTFFLKFSFCAQTCSILCIADQFYLYTD